MTEPDGDRDPVEELAAEFSARLRGGENPDIEEYARRCPDRATEVRELFPTVAVVERSKARRARSADGRASLGGPRPDRLGDFRIVREIGRGGMGVVYEAVQESLGRPVAVKVLPRRTDPAERERFRLEARTAARLHHTHIVPVYADGEHDGLCFFAMQLVTGVGLDELTRYLANGSDGSMISGRPDRVQLAESVSRGLAGAGDSLAQPYAPDNSYWRQVARLSVQVGEALHAAHAHGVLHRDVKPANLLLDAGGHVWVSDFGLAKPHALSSPGPDAGFSGTLCYMAPEALDGHGSPRTDVYGLGVTLYELLTLRRAFLQRDHDELVRAIRTGQLTSPRILCPSLPRDLDAIVLRAMARDPDRRYASASELAEDLRRFLDGRPVAARPVGPVGRGCRWAARNPAVAVLSGVVAFLLFAVTGVSAVGYVNTRRALEAESHERGRAEAALLAEVRERDRAEDTAVVALDALDRTFARLAPRKTGTALGGFGNQFADVPFRPVVAPETAAFLEDLLASYDRLAARSGGNPTIRRATARANLRVGDINRRLGRFDAGLTGYRRALVLYDSLALTPNESDRAERALALNEIGLMMLFLGREPSEGRQHFREAIGVLKGAPNPRAVDPQERFELARSYYFLGLRSRPATRPGGPNPPARHGGEEALRDAILVTTELKARFPDVPAYRHLLACCYRELGFGALSEEGQTAIALLEKLCDDFPGEPDFPFDLSEAYADFGIEQLPAPGKQKEDIERYLRKALATAERLAAGHPNGPEYTFSLGQIRLKLGTLLLADRRAAAEEQLRAAVNIQTELVRRFPAFARYRVWLAAYQGALAELLADTNQCPEAIRLLGAAVTTLEKVLAQDPDQRFGRASLIQTYTRLARVCEQAGLPERAAEARRRVEAMRPTR